MIEFLPQILEGVATILGLGLIQWHYNRKATKRLAEAQAELAETQNDAEEWHIYKEQLEAEREHVRFKDERISELLKMNQEKENRFVEQTQRLRETQARELEANEARIKIAIQLAEANGRIAELERLNGILNLRLSNNECIKHGCIHRDPPNEHTKKALAALNNKSVTSNSNNENKC